MNNKFYDQYKSLFTEPYHLSYLKPSLPQYQSDITGIFSPSAKFKINPNTKHNNQPNKLFKQYARNEMKFDINNHKSRQYESVANRQLTDVILPKLKIYDQEIDKKLKRFSTEPNQEVFMGRNYSLVEGVKDNNSKYYSDQNYLNEHNNNRSEIYDLPNSKILPDISKLDSPLHQLANKLQHSRYKHGYKFPTPRDNIFVKYDQKMMKITNNKNTSFYNPEKPQIHAYSSNLMNPETDIQEASVKRSRIKRKSPIFYMKGSEEDLETEYQRSYSNKKLPKLQQQHKDIFRISRGFKNKKTNMKSFHQANKNVKNFNEIKGQKVKETEIQIDNQLIHIQDKQYSITNNNNYHLSTQPSSPSQVQITKPHHSSLKPSRKQSRNNNPKLNKTQLYSCTTQQGIKFSQYSNQYAFINRRLDDIQKFNNYYTHNYINSYKRAIVDRLQGKRNMKERRGKLKYLLENEQLEYEREEFQ